MNYAKAMISQIAEQAQLLRHALKRTEISVCASSKEAGTPAGADFAKRQGKRILILMNYRIRAEARIASFRGAQPDRR